MHAVLKESLEEYLAGALEPAALRVVEAHLKACEECREEAAGMRQVSLLMGALKAERPMEVPVGFYSRVMQQVGDRKPVPTFSSLFALDFAFGRRLAFACLLTLAVLGSYLVTTENGQPAALSPEVVMAEQDAPAFNSSQAHEAMLATLTRYEP